MLCTNIMHQSIPAVPIPPPPGNRGAFAQVVSPGDGASAILSRPGGWAFAYPGGDPRAFDTRVLESAMDEFIGKDKAFSNNGLSVRDYRNLFLK